MCITGTPESKERETGTKRNKVIMDKDFPKLMTDTKLDPRISEKQAGKKSKWKLHWVRTYSNFRKTKDKENILTEDREK